jgi:hypothetical protein
LRNRQGRGLHASDPLVRIYQVMYAATGKALLNPISESPVFALVVNGMANAAARPR